MEKGTQDFYHFRLDCLDKMATKYGSQSVEFRRALKLIKENIEQVVLGRQGKSKGSQFQPLLIFVSFACYFVVLWLSCAI